MPTVTQSRFLEEPKSSIRYPGQNADWVSPLSVMQGVTASAPRQTTTSFRTGVRWDPVEDFPDSRNQAAFRKWLLRNEKDQNWSRPYDTGHEFDTVKYEVFLTHEKAPFTHWYYGPIGQGPVVPALYGSSWGSFMEPPLADLDWYGTRAIQLTRPTSPHVNLSVGLAELYREGFPHMVRAIEHQADALRSAQAVGDTWLAASFGWSPLISDLIGAVKSALQSKDLIRQFHRDAGKVVRRRWTFPPLVKTQYLGTESGYLLRADRSTEWDGCFVNRDISGQVSHSTREENRVWFSGAYSYVSSVGDDLLSRMKRLEQDANILFGTRLTPEVLWNLTPWSWLSDWQNTIGTTISNASALQDDGLVIRWGYLMNTSIKDHVVTLKGPRLISGFSGPYSITYRVTRKRRIRATPYGFGQNPSAFTARQWSILGALGLTKGPSALK